MSNDGDTQGNAGQAESAETRPGMPSDDELEEPSTEKDPGAEPKPGDAEDGEAKARDKGEPEPSHEAVGIGVIGAPLVEPDQVSDGQ